MQATFRPFFRRLSGIFATRRMGGGRGECKTWALENDERPAVVEVLVLGREDEEEVVTSDRHVVAASEDRKHKFLTSILLLRSELLYHACSDCHRLDWMVAWGERNRSVVMERLPANGDLLNGIKWTRDQK